MRARSRPWLAVILPALLLRALIPFGFMPVAGAGGPTVELCPGAAAMPGAAAGHHHHQGTGAPDGSAHALCVFAASAAPAVAPVAPVVPLAATNSSLPGQKSADCIRLPSILRAQSARAPPSLA